jgi:hypothetical protein
MYVVRIQYGAPCRRRIEKLEYASKKAAVRAATMARNLSKVDPCIDKITIYDTKTGEFVRRTPFPFPSLG